LAKTKGLSSHCADAALLEPARVFSRPLARVNNRLLTLCHSWHVSQPKTPHLQAIL
jgi:hypothetical protein